jgi:hypothetical protein
MEAEIIYVYKSSKLVSILTQINPVQSLSLNRPSFKLRFNIIPRVYA